MSSEEKSRLREVIIGYETAISNQSNVIASQSYELYLKDVIITNLNRQIDLKIEIARQDKVKLVGYGAGVGLVIGIVLRSFFN